MPPSTTPHMPGHLGEVVAVHDVARRGTHDREHLAGLRGLRSRGGDVRVDVADRDRDAFGESGPRRGLGGEAACALAELPDAMRELGVREAGKVGVERGLEFATRIGAVLQDPLVPGGARVADVFAAELPDDPVRGLDPVVHARVELRVLLEQLERLRVLPLRGDEAAVARQPRLVALARERVDAVSLCLARVVLPQLDVGVRAVLKLRDLAQRRAVGEHRQRGRRGEVGGNAHDEGGVDACGGHGVGNRAAQDLAVVVRHLERPLGGKSGARRREGGVHDGVRIVVNGAAELGAVGGVNDERAA